MILRCADGCPVRWSADKAPPRAHWRRLIDLDEDGDCGEFISPGSEEWVVYSERMSFAQ